MPSNLLNQISSIPVFVSTIDIRESRIKSLSERKQKYSLENNWYQFVQGLAETKSNVYVFDLAELVSDIGRRHLPLINIFPGTCLRAIQ